jgi:ABC-type dipeptide/oligopeptide/nickel transport system permease component
MRELALELVAIIAIAILIVCAALGLVPGDIDTTWAGRTLELLKTATTMNFAGASWAYPSAIAVIGRAALFSLSIIGSTVALLVMIGVPLGVVSVTRSRSTVVKWLRRTVDTVSATPVLVLGTVVFVAAGRQFGVTLREDTAVVPAVLAAIFCLTFGDRLLGDVVQRVEIATRSVLEQPYMRAVRAADLGYRRHLLQSIVPPVTEALAARSMFLISGAIVAELVFFVHGLGFQVLHAVATNDDPRLILALSMALIAIGASFRVLHRGALAMADPRRRR